MLLFAGPARAQAVVTLPAAPAPFENGVTHGVPSVVTFDVRNTTNKAIKRVLFQLPTGYRVDARASTSAGGDWSVCVVSGTTQQLMFNSRDGIARGGSNRFGLGVTSTSPAAASSTDNEGQTQVSVSDAYWDSCSVVSVWFGGFDRVGNVPPFPRRVLHVSSGETPLQQLAPPAVVTWTVTNYASADKNNVVLDGCSGSLSLGRYPPATAGSNVGTRRCTYQVAGPGSYTYSTRARDGAATSAGTQFGPIDVGAARVSWVRSTLVLGRPRDPIELQVVNASRATITRVDVTNASSGWSVQDATTSSSALVYDAPGSTRSDQVFQGAIAPGETVTLKIWFSGSPNVSTRTLFPFQVKLTPTAGNDYSVSFAQDVALDVVAFPPDVSRLTVLSTPTAPGRAGGQTLSWTNPTTAHSGVVVFRAAPSAPAPPVDFVRYEVGELHGTSEVVFANHTDPTVRSFFDPAVGVFHYLVCNHDASFVYSECRTDTSQNPDPEILARQRHYYAQSAVAPAGGWTHQFGGEALMQIQLYAVTNDARPELRRRSTVPTNRGEVSVVNLANGVHAPDLEGRPIEPIPVTGGLPSTYTPGWRLANGQLLAVAADQDGWLTAIDLESGKAWRERIRAGPELPYESFSAGVSGVASTGGSPAFKRAYPSMDVMFLGSANSGRVLAIDAASRTVLWHVETGSRDVPRTVDALTIYDQGTNSLWVPTSKGVVAYDLEKSSGVRGEEKAPPEKAWMRDAEGVVLAAHTIHCVRTAHAAYMACVDTEGTLRVVNKSTGWVQSSVDTSVSLPSSLRVVTGGTPGFIVGNATKLVRVAADASLSTLTASSSWGPTDWTLSPIIVLSAERYVVVAANDLSSTGIHLYKLSTEDLHEVAVSPYDVTPADRSTIVGPPSYDSNTQLFFFGTEEGRVWAVPYF